jgi:tryptophanyl-tRNA synthetase
MNRKISLSGIKPTGTIHLGNYLGMIRPALDLAKEYRAIYFIADAHALNQVHNGDDLERWTYEVAALWLAVGMDPDEVVFFRQSDIPEIFELTTILAASTSKGLMNRAHAYKDAVDANLSVGRDPDAGINMGLYTYPILMAADILLYGSYVVPVGKDQHQHVEIAADIAGAFNHTYGDTFVIPEALIRPEVAIVPGTDGRKMSKSYDNVIPVFAPSDEIHRRIMSIVTDSRRKEESKDPGTDILFGIYHLFATPDEVETMRQTYLRGGFGYGEVKQAIFEVLERTFGERRKLYENYLRDRERLDIILQEGAEKARAIATSVIQKVRGAVGFRKSIG